MKSMRIASMAIVVCTLFAVALNAQTAQVDTKTETEKCFELQGSSDYFFGVIDPTETVEHTFVFKNTCDKEIEIAQARASCGCTAAVISEKVIAPGGEAKINVKFTPPRGSRGRVSKTVSVYLKDEQKAHTIIRFSAKIKTDMEIKPTYIQLNGAEVGKPISGTATITNVTMEELEITDMSIRMTAYTDTSGTGAVVAMPFDGATVEPKTARLKPNESLEVKVTATPKYNGQMNGSVTIKTSGNEGMLQVFGIVREADALQVKQ